MSSESIIGYDHGYNADATRKETGRQGSGFHVTMFCQLVYDANANLGKTRQQFLFFLS